MPPPEQIRQDGNFSPEATFGVDVDEQEVMACALELILEFANQLVKDPLEIEVRDERELPASKDTMIDCFVLILMSEPREEWRKAFYNSGLKLAYFWPDIGPSRLSIPAGVFDDAFRPASPALTDDEKHYSSLVLNADHIHYFSTVFSRVGPEHERIAAIFDEAVAKIVNLLQLEN